MQIIKGVLVLFVLTIAGPYFPGGGQTGLAAAEEIYDGPWFGRIIKLSDEDQTYQLLADLSAQPPVNQQQDNELPEVHIFIDEELANELVHHEIHNRNRRSINNESNNKNTNVNKNYNYNGRPASAPAAQPNYLPNNGAPSWCYYGPQYGYAPCYQRSY